MDCTSVNSSPLCHDTSWIKHSLDPLLHLSFRRVDQAAEAAPTIPTNARSLNSIFGAKGGTFGFSHLLVRLFDFVFVSTRAFYIALRTDRDLRPISSHGGSGRGG